MSESKIPEFRGAPETFLKPYDPKATEGTVYQRWEESGYFNPDNLPQIEGKDRSESFTIMMPPPNANGSLHAGHALFVTLEDIMIRYARMQGKKALWLPGADHAGFETQVVYEKKLEKEGRSRFDMSREDLYKEIYDFTMASKSFMEGQLRSLGASCDWSRLTFTLDQKIVNVVYDTFFKLWDDGLLYRGKRIVNWCSKHQTSLTNLETEYIERTDPFYYFQYGPFVIGTVRPETKFGDKYVVMHPADERYAQYAHGQKIELEWINGPIIATIIKDEASDPTMGSGVMTITPWHSGVDFEIAKRHGLDMEQVIDWRGKLLPIAGEFAGMSIKEARPKIVEKLKSKGLLVKTDEQYKHSVPVCYKCEREFEPQVKAQWFIKTQPLAEKAVEAVDSGETRILTEQHEKIFRHWMNNVHDWNISRQVAWGIPIPAYTCECGEGTITRKGTAPTCECGKIMQKDEDTFDTWFSSGQWPFATLGYPDKKDFADFYPTQVMETGADILFFWVARMMMLGIYRTGKSPFKDIYLHGLVRDAKGLKMSKSKGNVISPVDVSNEYGTDALRMGLIVGNAPGTDLNLDPRKIGAYKKFANKLWNVTRFVFESVHGAELSLPEHPTLTATDAAHLARLEELIRNVTDEMSRYQFHLASDKLYHYVWHEFADVILEETKTILANGTPEEKISRQWFLTHALTTSLKLLHPFMPFVTEEIWSHLPAKTDAARAHLWEKDTDLLLISKWPHIDSK